MKYIVDFMLPGMFTVDEMNNLNAFLLTQKSISTLDSPDQTFRISGKLLTGSNFVGELKGVYSPRINTSGKI